MSYDKPRPRPGQVCHYAHWNREGRIVEARYRPARVAREEAAITLPPAEAPPSRRRGATQAQGSLL